MITMQLFLSDIEYMHNPRWRQGWLQQFTHLHSEVQLTPKL